MALNAPLHLQRGNLRDERHLIDAPVARRAAHPFCDMDRVIEIHVIRKIVDARPVNRDAAFIAFAHRLEVIRRRKKLRVAVHAGFYRRHAGAGGAFDGSVAVAAVDPIVADVMFVAELHGLKLDRVLLIPIRGPRQSEKKVVDGEHGKRAGTNNRRSRNRIRALVKNLPHQEK